jgi:drug/metabolite transporter (DMT)-like permease
MTRFLVSPSLLLIYASLLWGGNTVVARAIIDDIGPLSISFWRWLLAIAVLLPFTWRQVRRDWPTLARNLGYVAALGFSSVTIYTVAVYAAAQTIPATNL